MVKKVLYIYKKNSNEVRQIKLDVNNIKEEQELVKNLIDAKKNNKNCIIRQNNSNDSDFAYIDGENIDDFIIKSNEIPTFETPIYGSNDMDFLFNNEEVSKPKPKSTKQKSNDSQLKDMNSLQNESEFSLEKQSSDLDKLMETMEIDSDKLNNLSRKAEEASAYMNSVKTYPTDSVNASQGVSYNSEQERQELEEKKAKLQELKQTIVGDK